MFKRPNRLLLVATTASALTAMGVGLLLYSMHMSRDFLVADLKLCPDKEPVCDHSRMLFQLVNLTFMFAAAFGAGLLTLSWKLPRRFAMCLVNVMLLLASLLSGAAVNLAMLFVGRAFAGLALGYSAVVLLFNVEVCHPRSRGYFVFLYPLFLAFGVFVSSFFQLLHGRVLVEGDALHMRDRVLWRLVQLLPCATVLVALVLLLFFFRYRTPYQLVERNMTDEARVLVERLYGSVGDVEKGKNGHAAKTEVQTPVGLLDKRGSVETNAGRSMDKSNFAAHDSAHRPVEEMLHEFDRDAEVAKKTPNLMLFSALATPLYFKTFAVTFVLACLHQLVGATVLFDRAPYVFRDVLGKSYKASVTFFLLMLFNFVVNVCLALFVNRVGRKPLLLIGSTLAFVFLFFANFGPYLTENKKVSNTLTLLGYFGFVMGYVFGLGGVTWVYLAEVFPTEIRNFCFSFVVFANFTVARLLAYLTTYLDRLKPMICDVFFFVVSLLTVVFVWLFVRETRGVALGKAYEEPGVLAFRRKRVRAA